MPTLFRNHPGKGGKWYLAIATLLMLVVGVSVTHAKDLQTALAAVGTIAVLSLVGALVIWW